MPAKVDRTEISMISRDTIRGLAGTTTYRKGIELFKADKVEEFTCDAGDSVDRVSGYVKGSGHNIYNVSLDIDTVYDELFDSYCDCPAYFAYDGICKHCVAMLLEYRESRLRNISIEEYLRSQNLKFSGPDAIKKGVKRTTNTQFKELLNRHAVNRALPLTHSETFGKVKLVPKLTVTENSIELEFKIGTKKLYVLKNVFDFETNIMNNASYKYGANLEFVHVLDSFEDESKEMVNYLLDWCRNNRERYSENYYYGYQSYRRTAKARKLELNSAELKEFFKIIGDREFLADILYDGEKKWRVTDGEIEKHIKITGDEDGIDVEMSLYRGVCFGGEYIFFDNGNIYLVPDDEWTGIEDFVKCMSSLPGSKVFIEKDDVPAFCRELLPAVKEKFTCDFENFNEESYGIVEPEFSIYIDMPQENMISIGGFVEYDQNKYRLYDNTTDIDKRDLYKEAVVTKIIAKYTNSFDEVNKLMILSGDEDRLYELIDSGLNELQEAAQVFVSDEIKKIEIKTPPSAKVGISLSGDLLEMTISSENMAMDELIEILSKYNRKKKYFRLKNGSFVRTDMATNNLYQIKNVLGLTDKQLQTGKVVIPKYRALYLDNTLSEDSYLTSKKDKNFKALIRNMKTVGDSDFEVPETLNKVLRSYQKYGFMWIKTMNQNGFGGILADDMGLGKTLQVIAFLLSEIEEGTGGENKKTLIVCPASLVYNWQREIERFAPKLNTKLIVGNASERKQNIESIENENIVITSYDLLRRDIELYKDIDFRYQIIDEAQYIKNHNTLAAKAVKEINSVFKLALTGTPIENKLSELHSIFEYLMPGFLYTYKKFKDSIEQPIVLDSDEDAMERLRRMISPFILRRLKKDVLKDLPDKVEENIYINMEGEQRKLYDAHVNRIKLMLEKTTDEEFKKGKLQVLSELTKLRQLCCNPKLLFDNYDGESAKNEACLQLISSAIENGHKVLLFSQFTTMLEKLQEQLAQNNISYYTLTGSTDKERRTKLVESFNKDDTSVFCISLKAGGTGLNLTSADIVIHYDPWWNVAVQNQATDRAHRIGQKNVVNVYKLVAKDSIEENIIELQNKKKELADNLLSGEDIGKAGFDKEEILKLLG